MAQIFWFTGLSGAGKTTIANAVKIKLEQLNYSVLIIDGDDVRRVYNKHLGFTPQDIKENNSLIANICLQNRGKYNIILVPIISPLKESRERARELLKPKFYEIYFDASLSVVIRRDVKGLYAKAMKNEITNMIGFSPDSKYDFPENPDFIVKSGCETPEVSEKSFFNYILSKVKIG